MARPGPVLHPTALPRRSLTPAVQHKRPRPNGCIAAPGAGAFWGQGPENSIRCIYTDKENPNLFPYKNRFGFFLFGGPGGIRTLDLSDANRTLSQLSYRPICKAGRSILSMTNVLRLIYYTAFWRNCQADFSGFSVQAGLSFPGDAKGRPEQSRRTSRHWRGGSVLWMRIGEYQGESLLT